MLVVVASGVLNALAQVESVAALMGTTHGRLLLAKLVVLVPILALAVVNRTRILPAVAAPRMMRRLAAFVAVEAGLALFLLVLAAAMTLTTPARHAPPTWPLPFRLSLDVVLDVPAIRWRVLIGTQLVVGGFIALLVSIPIRRRRERQDIRRGGRARPRLARRARLHRRGRAPGADRASRLPGPAHGPARSLYAAELSRAHERAGTHVRRAVGHGRRGRRRARARHARCHRRARRRAAHPISGRDRRRRRRRHDLPDARPRAARGAAHRPPGLRSRDLVGRQRRDPGAGGEAQRGEEPAALPRRSRALNDGTRRSSMMPVWQVALVLNLVFAVGLGLGYAGWGRRAAALDRDVDAARAQVERLERERVACAAGARAGEQPWEGRGVVRPVYPQLLVVTHEEIRGLLPARTTSFRFQATSPTVRTAVRVGEPIRFALRGTVLDDAAVVAVKKW